MARRSATIRFSVEDMASGVMSRINANWRQLMTGVASGQAVYNLAAGALQKMGQMVQSAFSAVMEAEEAQVRLNAALRNAGVITEESQKKIAGFAQQFGFQLGKSDEQVAQFAATLVRMTGATGEDLQRLVRAAYDLSAAFGVELEAAVKAVGKAANGNTTALGKMGVQLDQVALKAAGTGKALRDELIRQIERMAGGAAVEQAQTLHASINRLKEGLTNFLEVAAGGLLKLTDSINEAAGFYQHLAEQISGAKKEQEKFNQTIAEMQRLRGVEQPKGLPGSAQFDIVGASSFARAQLMKPWLEQARNAQQEIAKMFGGKSGNFLAGILGSEYQTKTLEQFVLSMFSDKAIAALGPQIKDRLDEVFGIIEKALVARRVNLDTQLGEPDQSPVVAPVVNRLDYLEEQARRIAEAIEANEARMSAMFTTARSALMSQAAVRAGWFGRAAQTRIDLLRGENPFAAEKMQALFDYAKGLENINLQMKQYQEILAMIDAFDITGSGETGKKKKGPNWALPGLEEALKETEKTVSQTDQIMRNIALELVPAIVEGFSEGLRDMAHLGDHLKDMFENVLEIVMEILIKVAIIKGLETFMGPLGFLNAGGFVENARKASTGLLVGPTTHDAVPILATPGEYVMPRATAERVYGRGQQGGDAASSGVTLNLQMRNAQRERREVLRDLEDYARRRGGRIYATDLVG